VPFPCPHEWRSNLSVGDQEARPLVAAEFTVDYKRGKIRVTLIGELLRAWRKRQKFSRGVRGEQAAGFAAHTTELGARSSRAERLCAAATAGESTTVQEEEGDDVPPPDRVDRFMGRADDFVFASTAAFIARNRVT